MVYFELKGKFKKKKIEGCTQNFPTPNLVY